MLCAARRLTLFMCGLSAVPCCAAEPALMARVRSLYAHAATVQSNFTLDVYWQAREKTERTSGRIYLARGDKFRVEAGRTLWVSDGRNCWQYSPASRQTVIKSLADMELSALPSHILASYIHNRRYRMVRESGREMVVEPDFGASPKQTVTLSIDKKTARVTALRLSDAAGNSSAYAFHTTIINAPIPEEKFTFAPPADSDILDLRR